MLATDGVYSFHLGGFWLEDAVSPCDQLLATLRILLDLTLKTCQKVYNIATFNILNTDEIL